MRSVSVNSERERDRKRQSTVREKRCRDFPGGPVVKTSSFNAEAVDLIPELDLTCRMAKKTKT